MIGPGFISRLLEATITGEPILLWVMKLLLWTENIVMKTWPDLLISAAIVIPSTASWTINTGSQM